MKNSRPTPEELNWDKTVDNHMSRLDFARYFCQGKTGGMRCGVFTGGGRCEFHSQHKDTDARQKIGNYSGYSKAYVSNKGSEEANDE